MVFKSKNLSRSAKKPAKKPEINFGPSRVDQFDKIYDKILSETKNNRNIGSLTASDIDLQSEVHSPKIDKSRSKISIGYTIYQPRWDKLRNKILNQSTVSVITKNRYDKITEINDSRNKRPASAYVKPEDIPLYRRVIREIDYDLRLRHDDGLPEHKRDIYQWLKVTCK